MKKKKVKSLKERAHKFALEICPPHPTTDLASIQKRYEELYYKIAKEQEECDNEIIADALFIQHQVFVEKVCKWLKDNGCFSYLQEGNQTIEDIENMFRKAMEK